MNLPFLPYAKQSIEEQDRRAVAEALKENFITRGPLVQRFEQTVAEALDVPYAVCFSSGTAALMAAYFAAHLSPVDRVFSTPNTFIATVGAAVNRGIRPHFVDIDRTTGHLDLEQLREALDFRSTRGRPFIVPVHFAGIAVDMVTLNAQIAHPDAVIIEDAAHALGSYYPTGQKVGSCAFSHMTIFSFHPAKILTTGEGGMVTTADAALHHRLLLFRDNGIERTSPYLLEPAHPGYYEVHAVTGNYHMTSFQAALGLSQWQRLDKFVSKRRQLVKRYRQHLSQMPHLTLLNDQQDELSAFHLFVVQIDFQAYQTTREKVMHALQERGIGSRVHYIPLYHHPVFKRSVQEREEYPQMELYYQQTLSLPLFFDLTDAEVDRICDELRTILHS